MSAIVGIVHFNKQLVNMEHGRNLMNSLEKFPADDVQVLCEDYVFLGCHAQWITPESVNEKLPYYDSERECAITADVIIDNREELFERLQVNLEKRKSITDSELILHSYYKWGADAPNYLVGDFAFMIWDSRENKLFGARDFTGARTLYYFHDQQRFAFSTIIEPLFTLPYIRKQLNESWLAEFLVIPDMLDSADPSATIYYNIKQIPPGHSISVDRSKFNIQKFHALDIRKKLLLKSNEEYEEAFRDVFQKAVSEKTRTYKNVGAQLSGGLDSSSVVSFAVQTLKKKNKPMHTFSYIPPSDFFDFTPKNRVANETPFIKSIVNHVGNIDDHYLDFEGRSSLTEVDEMLEIMEMPYKFSENSFWLKGSYEKAHEKNIGVLLNGAGGNFTISWGLATEYYAHLLKRLRLLRLYHEIDEYSKKTGARKSRLVSVIGKTAYPGIYQILASNKQNKYEPPVLISPEFAHRTKVYSKLREKNYDIDGLTKSDVFMVRKEWFEKGLYWNTYGTVASKLSLRYSLWNRDPTNDLRVIKFCLTVPEDQFVQDGFGRSLVRRATQNYLPDNVRLNQKTRGIQGADWVHRILPSWNLFMDEIELMVNKPAISNFLNTELLRNLIFKYKDKPRSDYAFNPEIRILMRSLIVMRFLNSLE
ncbi:asparagine synthase-related protein [Neobacillus sp. MER 74]|uniref:asparagine synthase-related protein n=1 Tax=Neobacillus sp. MER 74 TaxID=2939566 RepID=UPI00203E1934|nr:asparagine synthase-related protein [Neobacillus sp. MER 74]MCM3115110.1 asparagine synthase-related protein [Neobacillus sp. MER 74]